MKKILMIAILLLSVLAAYSQSKNETGDLKLTKTQQEVWNNVIDLHNAVFGSKNADVISSLVGEGLTYGHSGGILEDRPTMIQKAAESATVYENVTNQLLSVKSLGKITTIRVILKATSIEKGASTPLNLGILQVWNKVGGNCKLIERQAVKRSVP